MGPLCCAMHVKEPSTLINKRQGLPWHFSGVLSKSDTSSADFFFQRFISRLLEDWTVLKGNNSLKTKRFLYNSFYKKKLKKMKQWGESLPVLPSQLLRIVPKMRNLLVCSISQNDNTLKCLMSLDVTGLRPPPGGPIAHRKLMSTSSRKAPRSRRKRDSSNQEPS